MENTIIDKGHEKLIEDIKNLLEYAERYEYHDFKNNLYAMPKVALVEALNIFIDSVKHGDYDN